LRSLEAFAAFGFERSWEIVDAFFSAPAGLSIGH